MSKAVSVQDANADFALNLYQNLSSNGKENLIVSPYSVSTAMAMVLLGAKGNTAEQIKKGLALKDVSDKAVNAGNLEILKSISSLEGSVVLETANKLFPEKTYILQKEFLQDCLKYYLTEIEPLNYIENPEKSRVCINKWAQKQTKDKIKDLLPSGSINSEVRLVLANAIYFKGNWKHQFEVEQTQLMKFYVNKNKTVKVKMMSQERKFKINYDAELGVQGLELPYEGNDVSMILLVPTNRFGLQNLEENLTSEKLNTLFSGLSLEDVIVSLPQMKIEYDADLVPTLKKLGIHDVFDQHKANLQRISGIPELSVSGVYHKAFVEVNEEGSEAAAATAGVMMLRCSMPLPPVRVTCDHPFMFLIKHNPTQSVLFLGRFLSPSA